MATTKLVYEVEVDSGNSVRTLSQIENELEQINSELKETDVNSDAFRTLSKESQRLGKELTNVNNSIQGLALEDKLTALDGGIKVAAGSLTTLIGSVGLLGVESEALEDFEKKALGAIAIATGVKDLSEGFGQLAQVITKLPAPTKIATIATKAFNTVLRANPVGLIVTGVTLLLGLFVTFNKRIRETVLQFEPLNKVVNFVANALRKLGQALGFVASEEEMLAEKTRELAAANTEALENQLALAKIRGEDTIELERRILKEKIKATVRYTDERKKAEFELQKFEEQVRADRRKEQEAENKKRIEDEKKQAEELKRIAQERASAIAEIQKASVVSASDRLALDIQQVNNQYDRLVKLARKYGLDTEKLEKARLAKLEELNKEYNDRILEIEEQRYTDIELLNQNLEALAIKYINDEEQLRKESRQKELEDTQKQFDELILEAQRLSLDTQNIELEKLIAIENLKDRYKAEDAARQAELDARQAELDAQRIANAQEVQSTLDNLRIGSIDNQFQRELQLLDQELQNNITRLQAFGATEEQITELTQFYAKKRGEILQAEEEEDKRKQLEKLARAANTAGIIFNIGQNLLSEDAKKQKSVAIAQAVISTLVAATRALSATPGPPFTLPNVALALASGYAQVRKIKQQDETGGGGISTSAPAISAPRNLLNPADFATAQTPNINFGSNIEEQIEQTTSKAEPIRAFVVSGDVKSGLEADQKIRQRRTVGRLKPE